uniref:Dentin sialophosphoprotein-like n=1 Tax=Strongyloides papillosus TaxID=174720 RepID=A0A0N5BMD2_STREA
MKSITEEFNEKFKSDRDVLENVKEIISQGNFDEPSDVVTNFEEDVEPINITDYSVSNDLDATIAVFMNEGEDSINNIASSVYDFGTNDEHEPLENYTYEGMLDTSFEKESESLEIGLNTLGKDSTSPGKKSNSSEKDHNSSEEDTDTGDEYYVDSDIVSLDGQDPANFFDFADIVNSYKNGDSKEPISPKYSDPLSIDDSEDDDGNNFRPTTPGYVPVPESDTEDMDENSSEGMTSETASNQECANEIQELSAEPCVFGSPSLENGINEEMGDDHVSNGLEVMDTTPESPLEQNGMEIMDTTPGNLLEHNDLEVMDTMPGKPTEHKDLETMDTIPENALEHNGLETTDTMPENALEKNASEVMDIVSENPIEHNGLEVMDTVPENALEHNGSEVMGIVPENPTEHNGSKVMDIVPENPTEHNGSKVMDIVPEDPTEQDGSEVVDIVPEDPIGHNSSEIVDTMPENPLEESDDDSEIVFENVVAYTAADYSGDEGFPELVDIQNQEYATTLKTKVFKSLNEKFELSGYQKARLDQYLTSYVKYLLKNKLREGMSYDDSKKYTKEMIYKFTSFATFKVSDAGSLLWQMVEGTVSAKELSRYTKDDFISRKHVDSTSGTPGLDTQDDEDVFVYPCKKCSTYHTRTNTCRQQD